MSTMSDLHYCINEARRIKRTLGTRTAAGYLRNQGVDLSLALAFLVARRGIGAEKAQPARDRRDRRAS
jgi:hypothetical protein